MDQVEPWLDVDLTEALWKILLTPLASLEKDMESSLRVQLVRAGVVATTEQKIGGSRKSGKGSRFPIWIPF